MIKVENIDVHGFKHAVKSARNPMSSWAKSDSVYLSHQYCDENKEVEMMQYCDIVPALGKNDLDLLQRLYRAGVEHRTYARMIYVWMDITAPLYMLKELDRYTIGKSQVSTSTMHKIHAKEFTLDDFSHEHLGDSEGLSFLRSTINGLNFYRSKYIDTKDKHWWWQMIQLLPSSYNQMRTVCMSYEVVFKIIHERTGHKLDEWQTLVDILKGLPYVKEIMGE